MQKYYFFDTDNNSLNVELVLSFTCSSNKKNYVILDNQEKIFNSSSHYNNLDVLEISSHTKNNFYLKEIPNSEWETVQNFIYENIFGKIKSIK